LFAAALHGDRELVELLLAKGADASAVYANIHDDARDTTHAWGA
jgi:hypothetical protein